LNLKCNGIKDVNNSVVPYHYEIIKLRGHYATLSRICNFGCLQLSHSRAFIVYVNNMVVCYHYEIIDHMIYLYNLYSLCSGNNLLPTECVCNAFNKYMLSDVSGGVEIHWTYWRLKYIFTMFWPYFFKLALNWMANEKREISVCGI